MNITWQGHSCFRITEKLDNSEVAIVTDPYDKETGLFPPKLYADIVTISHHHHDHDYLEKVVGNLNDNFVVFDRPGEYEVKHAFVVGIQSSHNTKSMPELGSNTIFRIEMDGLVVVHLGDLGRQLNEEELETLGTVDVLFVPVGGKYTLNGEEAAEVVRQIEPRIVIPMHYLVDGLTIDIADESKFIKAMGGKFEKMDKLKISRKDLPEDNTKVVVLEKS